MDDSTADPACDLDPVPNESRKANFTPCLGDSFDFGGHDDTLAVTAFNE